jgi:hypothetical protein
MGVFSRALNHGLHRFEFNRRYGAILKAGGIDIAANIEKAKNMGPWDFVNAVKTKGFLEN